MKGYIGMKFKTKGNSECGVFLGIYNAFIVEFLSGLGGFALLKLIRLLALVL